MSPQNTDRLESVRMGGCNIERPISYHRSPNVYSFLCKQTFQLLMLLNADVATAYKLKKLSKPKVLEYSFSKISSLRCTDTQESAFPCQVAQSLRYSGIQDIFGVADLGISLTELGYEFHGKFSVSKRDESTERIVDRRPYIFRYAVLGYWIESECCKRIVHRSSDTESRIAYGPVKVEHEAAPVHAA